MTPEHHEDEPLDHLPVPSDRVVRILAVAVVLLVMLGLILFGARLYVLTEHQRDTDRTNAAQDQALKEANRRLEEAGEPTVSVPASPEPGEPGESGQPGEEGPTGDTGDTGATGLQGPPGPEGKRGPRGFTGLDGSGGTPGERGPDGQQGPPGPTGTAGPQGDPGPKGEPGNTGPQGEQGPAGTANPGTYLCPDGQVLVGFTVSANGSVDLACQGQLLGR